MTTSDFFAYRPIATNPIASPRRNHLPYCLMEAGKHGLTRELRLWDLVPMQVVIIVWLGWTGFAAKQGPTQVVLWLLAIVLFYLPLAAVVMKLSRTLPVEGGVYQWVKEGLSPFAGYLAGWNLTVFSVTAFAVTGSMLANGFAHAAGPRGAWMSTNKTFAIGITAAACLLALVFNITGLHFAKWWSNTGSLLTIATFAVMLVLLAHAWLKALPLAHASLSLAWPGFSILTLNVFTKMAIGALAGFDSSAIFSEECRKPENDVARSVMIAAPLIALMYILGTSTVLAYIEPRQVDLAAAVPQVMQAGFGTDGFGGIISALVAVAFNLSFVATMIIYVGMIARLPMVAGWDGLLPPWWSELHPKFRTPTKAIVAVSASILILGVLSLVGAGNQEAVQVAVAAGVGSLCIMYALLFGVVLFAFHWRGVQLGLGIRLAALPAFLVAVIGLIFQIVPLGEVASPATFSVKVVGTICATNAFAAFLYWQGSRRAAERMAAQQAEVAPITPEAGR